MKASKEQANSSLNCPSMITLVSAEEQTFQVSLEHAILSPVIKSVLLNPACEESRTKRVHFPGISTQTLKKVVEYMEFKRAHQTKNSSSCEDEHIPDFPIDPQEAVDLLQAADFLDL